jgi:nicotinate-nucleotide--dimethylbenzimidazole phosphoribosyltransferase
MRRRVCCGASHHRNACAVSTVWNAALDVADGNETATAVGSPETRTGRYPPPQSALAPHAVSDVGHVPALHRARKGTVLKALLDAVLVDIGGTLVESAPAGTPVADLEVHLRDSAVADLTWLRHTVIVGAVTNTAMMDEAQVRQLLEPSGVSSLLDVIVTSVDVGIEKPDPKPILVALERLGLDDPNRVLYIGDHPDDEAAALAAGVRYEGIGPIGSTTSAPNGKRHDAPNTIRQVVQAWIERAAGHRFEEARARIDKSDIDAANLAVSLQGELTKPAGSLGRVEALGTQLAAIARTCPPPIPEPATVAIFASDHGVVNRKVSPWPQEVTAQMVANFTAGGAAINVLARHAGAEVIVVDVGVATPLAVTDHPSLVHRNVRRGTSSLAVGPAMTRTEALLALDVGVAIAQEAVRRGTRCLITGDMGIGNTTAASAIIAGITDTSPEDVTGRGSGADDAMLARKTAIIEAAITGLTSTSGPLTLLERVGGFEIAAMAGLIVGGAACGVPVIVDGVIADAALLIATQLAPDVIDYVIAGHCSTEPAAIVALEFLGLSAVLDLGLRLGEGTGATLALPVVQAAAKVLREMATFDSAGVSASKA